MSVTAAAARDAVCYSCGKRGHFSRVCRTHVSRRYKSTKSASGSSAVYTESSPTFNMMSAACPGSLLKASLPVMIDGKRFTALIDSGSSESYISTTAKATLSLDIYPSSHKVQMASSAVKVKSAGFCLADVTVQGVKYPSTKLNVPDSLCCDVILGLDFQCNHQRLIFEFSGGAADLVVSNENSCAVTAASVEEVHLITNLSPDVKPIATKSRRFSEGDRGFIEESIEKLLADGVIRPSSSPWRAQVIVVKDETDRHKKRLCASTILKPLTFIPN